MLEPIAVVGSGFRLPGGVTTPSELWGLLKDPHDLLTMIPASRFNAQGFYHANSQHHGHSNVNHSYFLSNDDSSHRRFDAKFFNIRPAEAAVMDPQIRMLLEVVYEALECGGLTLEGLRASDTAVYTGIMVGDYERLMLRDEDTIGRYHVTGTTRCLASNRISYFFDWRGPSVTLDTACSSSLVAVHTAVQQLRSGQSRMAIAAGANLLLDPHLYITESKLNMLSPDGRSRMWDANANGYARGEGVVAVVLKRLSDAEADGDSIECVIRETGVNQDGRTQGITMPSSEAQARLIRECYHRAGLDLSQISDRPQYFEAHGTGTPVGDPIEAKAIAMALPPLADNTLQVGSIKTVMGHAEGAAGLAALMKTSLALQNATIPPNMLLDRLNPNVAPFTQNVEVPRFAQPWPVTVAGTPRRASVNSFGFGGTNAHVILESYCSSEVGDRKVSGEGSIPFDISHQTDVVFLPFVFSAVSETSLVRYLQTFHSWLRGSEPSLRLRDLAFTLCTRRSHHPVSVTFTAQSAYQLGEEIEHGLERIHEIANTAGFRASRSLSSPVPSKGPKVLGIFTGQGAGYPGMGASLVSSSPALQKIVKRLEYRLSTLPRPDQPDWSLSEELQRLDSTDINNAVLSQPLCTALQILQIELLRSTGVSFSAVIGHSSGEIAAAYAAGMITDEEALVIAYQRGLKCGLAQGMTGQQGSMMAVGASFEDVQSLCDEPEMKGRVCIAAVNSPASVTVSGDTDAIQEMQAIFRDEEKFARILRVDKAYHSHHMIPCSSPYRQSIEDFGIDATEGSGCSWYSSVFGGKRMEACAGLLGGEYWTMNMTEPVLFMQAVQHALATEGLFDLAIEVGPHPVLQSPTLQTLNEVYTEKLPYCGLSFRAKDPVRSFATALGFIWSHIGAENVDLAACDQFATDGAEPVFLPGMPNYAWEHEQEYWHESRSVRAIRNREGSVHELLGHLQPDSNEQELRWRNILRPQEVPWLSDHCLQGQIVFPAAGYVVMAIEASVYLSRAVSVEVIEILDLNIVKALTFDDEDSGVETIFSASNFISTETGITAQFKYHAAKWDQEGPLNLLAEGHLRIALGQPCKELLSARQPRPPNLMPVRPEAFYASLREAEYVYKGTFMALQEIDRKYGIAVGKIAADHDARMLIHPATLDAAFQSLLVAHSFPGDGRLWSMHVPKSIRSIRVNPHLCLREKERTSLIDFESIETLDSDSMEGDILLCSENSAHAMLQVEGLSCVPFSRATDQVDTCMFSETVRGSLSPDAELVAYDGQPTAEEDDLVNILERAAAFYLRVLHLEVPKDHPSRTTGPLTAYYTFAAHVSSLDRTTGSRFWISGWEEDTHETIAALCESHQDLIDVKLLRAIGENIVAIATGEKHAIEVGMNDDLLAQYYQNAIGMSNYTRYLARVVKQIVHRYPHMDILEIGAGTGGATRGIFTEIGQSLASYTFTDVSAGFFSAAHSKFAEFSHKMKFRVLDISSDPCEQGFCDAEQSYDLIVASMVLHATPHLTRTLKNVRRLLKPGGYLVVLEGYDNNAFRVGAIFGSFPGWWLGANDGRALSPCVDQARWDELLRETGFSGCDTITPDPDPLIAPLTLFVSQAVDDKVDFLREPLAFPIEQRIQLMPSVAKHNLVLLGGATLRTSRLSNSLKSLLGPAYGRISTFRSLVEAQPGWGPLTTVVSLLDLDEPIFESMTETVWERLKQLLAEVRVVLWVSHNKPSNRPYAQMMKGLLRCSTRELPTLHSQFLEVEDVKTLDARTIAEYLLRLQAASLWQRDDISHPICNRIEQELVLASDNKASIPRLLPSQVTNLRYNSSRRPIVSEQMMSGNVRLERTDSDTLLRHEIHTSDQRDVGARIRLSHSLLSAVKVSTTAHLYLVLGNDESSGQQAVALASTNSHFARVWNNTRCAVAPTPGSEAVFLKLVAQHVIIHNILERFSQGDRILVHEPDIHFAAAASLQAQPRGIGLSFTTKSSSLAMEEQWTQLRPYCLERTLRQELQAAQISAFIDLSEHKETELLGFRIRGQLNQSCLAEDLRTLFSEGSTIVLPSDSHQEEIHKRLQTAVTYAEQSLNYMNHDVVTHEKNSTLDLSAIARASKDRGPLTIVAWNCSSAIHITQQPVDSHHLFRASGTYWLAGLSGGLGLSLCEWMIRHGAQHVVISSRKPEVDERWLAQMESVGACVKVMSCDLNAEEEVSRVYSSIQTTMPPVIGVAQGAMVLEDTSIVDMPFDTLSKVLSPKVAGSMHLSDLFQQDTLDFMVFFSSVSAVVGNPGQSNYAAANHFMAGLVEQRRQRGLAASIIHIGPVVGVGYISQEDIMDKTVNSRSKGYAGISERDFHQLFAEAVLASSTVSGLPSEITTGVKPVQLDDYSGIVPGWAANPMFSHFVLNSQSDQNKASGDSPAMVPVKVQLSQAKSASEVHDIIRGAFVPKFCALFQLDLESGIWENMRNVRLDEAGIDSLLAVEVRGWFVKTLEVNIPVLRIMNATLGELITFARDTIVDLLSSACPSETASSPSQTTHDEEPFFAEDSGSFIQSRNFWFVKTAFDDPTSLNHSGSFKLTGYLNAEGLATAVHMIGRQHEALRTCFIERDGEGRQGVMDSSLLRLESRSIASEEEAEQIRLTLQNHVYNIRHGETIRIVLVSMSPTRHFLIIGANGLVMDGLSFQVFLADLQQHYSSTGKSAKETRQFLEYAESQHDRYATGRYEDSLKYWKEVYINFPAPMPLLRVSKASSRPPLAAYENVRVDIRIDSMVRSQIELACRQNRVTAFHFFLSVFRALIIRHGVSDAEDVSIGVGDANRTEHDMTESIGMFLNILPLRFHTSSLATFVDVLQDTRTNMYEALEHSDVPFQVIIDALEAPRAADYTPIFQCFIDYRQGQQETTTWAECQLDMLKFQASKTPYDIALDIIDNPFGESLLMFQVRKDLYDRDEAQLLASSYKHLVESFAASQEVRLDRPEMFCVEDTKDLMKLCKGPSFTHSWPETIIHRFYDVAKTWHDDVAIISETRASVTYSQLAGLVQAMVLALRVSGATSACRVAVLQEPTARWVSSALAVMHIGAVYVPLDLSTPWGRLSRMAKDCEATFLLVDNSTESGVPKLDELPNTTIINVESDLKTDGTQAPISATAEGIAMILYTSGSTGAPKGIELKHSGLRNWFEPTQSLYHLDREIVLQQSSSNFDMSFTQVATALCFGGSLYLLPRSLRGDAFAISEVIASRGVSYTCATPSEYSSWLMHGSTQLIQSSSWRMAVSAGEQLISPIVEQFAFLGKRDLRLLNMYGPTEISIVATAAEVLYHETLSGRDRYASVGHPLPNYSVYVVDEGMHLLPAGVQGEIYIGDAGVSPGYLNIPELTAAKFVPDVFATREHEACGWQTMHRTGDIGRWDTRRGLIIECRISGDTQIKLRGLRVDLREIECAIVEESAGTISEAVVTVRKGLSGSNEADFLVGHVVFQSTHTAASKEKEGFLRKVQTSLNLPQYMCPSIILEVNALPRTTSAKLDRRAVAAWALPDTRQGDESLNGKEGLTTFEIQLKDLWAEVIPGLKPTLSDKITSSANFFHVGGTSLLLVALQSRIKGTLGIKVPLVQMFRHSTLRAMASRIETKPFDANAIEGHQPLNWDEETAPSPDLQRLVANPLEGNILHHATEPTIHARTGRIVVLTGSTGFLGQALLAALVAEPSIEVIHCLAVRQQRSDEDELLTKMRTFPKVCIHIGDLTLPRLGVSEQVTHEIFSTADTVIHNGADVSYLKTYDTLRIANVEATKELARLCLPFRASFHYISTAGVGTFAARKMGSDYEFAAESASAFPPPVNFSTGTSANNDSGHHYMAMTATKWASERFLERTVALTGPSWHVHIHRPSLIVRPQESGENLDLVTDITWNIRKYARKLLSVPLIRSVVGQKPSSRRLNLVSPEEVVQGVLDTLLKAKDTEVRTNPNFIHHLGDAELHLNDIKSLVKDANLGVSAQDDRESSLDQDYKELPLEEWAQKATEAGMDANVAALLKSLESSEDIIFPRFV